MPNMLDLQFFLTDSAWQAASLRGAAARVNLGVAIHMTMRPGENFRGQE